MMWLRRAAIFAALSLLARGAQPSCIAVSWTAPGDDGSFGRCFEYQVRHSTSPITEGNWDGASPVAYPPTPLSSGGEQFLTVGELKPGVTYYIGVRALDERGNASGITTVFAGPAPENQCVGIRGNVDCDPFELIDIGDLTCLIDFLYVTHQPLCCPDEANIDGDPAGLIDMADLTKLIQVMYMNGLPPPLCP